MPETLHWLQRDDTYLCDLGPYLVQVWPSWRGDAALWLVQDQRNGAVVLKFAHAPGGIDQAKQEALVWAAAFQ